MTYHIIRAQLYYSSHTTIRSLRILQSGFYQILDTKNFAPNEQHFLACFKEYLVPLQTKQHSQDLFLKQRIDLVEPRLTLPGLHKYLKADQPKCFYLLIPRKLYQVAIFNALLTKQHLTEQQLSDKLHLDGTSLNYYRQELIRYELQ